MDLKIFGKIDNALKKKEQESLNSGNSLFSGAGESGRDTAGESASVYGDGSAVPPAAEDSAPLFSEAVRAAAGKPAAGSVFAGRSPEAPVSKPAPSLFSGAERAETAGRPLPDAAFMPPVGEAAPSLFSAPEQKVSAEKAAPVPTADEMFAPPVDEVPESLFTGEPVPAGATVYANPAAAPPAGEPATSLFRGKTAAFNNARKEKDLEDDFALREPEGAESESIPTKISAAAPENAAEKEVAEPVVADRTSKESVFAPPDSGLSEKSVSLASEQALPGKNRESVQEAVKTPASSLDHSFFKPPEETPAGESATAADEATEKLPETAGEPLENSAFKPPEETPAVEPVPVSDEAAEKLPETAGEPLENPAFMPPEGEADSVSAGQQTKAPVSEAAPAAVVSEAAGTVEETERLSKEEVRRANEQILKIIDNVETAMIGKRTAVELVLMTMLARGHVLLEDVPGVGKTSLLSCIARSVDCDFRRIQFTPDLMPSDITGSFIYNQKSGAFQFRPGSVMNNIVLADEINQASAKTQSAILEIMEEKQVTVDSQTFEIQEPFFVMATQIPAGICGNNSLPAARMDCFMIKLAIGYPNVEEEQRIVHSGGGAQKKLTAVVSRQDVLHLREQADRVWVNPLIERYIVEIAAATRAHAKIVLGSSPGASIALHNAAKAYALFRNRGYVIPDDVIYLAPYVLAHRLILSREAQNDQSEAKDLINEIVSGIAAPRCCPEGSAE